ncbi:Bile acid 7-alpha dehydratase [Gordonia insulae]|uniref:Bile acid 7-alpha dehydratase n=1 Tax=Gordonia insulae TaxID=2420509 RepID=A0A3G8JLL3_9ACTN|nr:Bile acid 7-alpha dehydratase [Gordonia insulae]
MTTVDVLDELRDVESIKRLRARVARCLDTKQWSEFGDCFTEDAVLEAPEVNLRWQGRDQIVQGISSGMNGVRSVHHLHAPEIELTGVDTATGVWAMSDSLERTSPDGPVIVNGYGHYRDTYVRDGGRWRVRSLRLERLRIDT